MKKTFVLVLLMFTFFNIFAKETKKESAEFTLRKAYAAYDIQDYGKALKYSEDAILYKHQRVDYELEVLRKSLSPRKVQLAGDKIEAVLKVLNERNEFESIQIINNYLKIRGADFFNDSITQLLTYIKGTEVYPEAQKLIGDIYKLEGEYQFAEDYYKMALDNSSFLDIPDEKFDILYMLADISRLEDNLEQMETRLFNILADDQSFSNKTLINSMVRTIQLNKNDSVEKFFTLYRADSYNSLIAYNELAEYYHDKGEKDLAIQFSALFAITSFTKISETIKLRNFAYEYNNLNTFLQEASFHQDIVKWGSENNVWKSFNVLAKYSNEYGYTNFARELLKVLAQYSPERYWQQEAVLQLERIDLQGFEDRN